MRHAMMPADAAMAADVAKATWDRQCDRGDDAADSGAADAAVISAPRKYRHGERSPGSPAADTMWFRQAIVMIA